jgi:hypothetical protein
MVPLFTRLAHALGLGLPPAPPAATRPSDPPPVEPAAPEVPTGVRYLLVVSRDAGPRLAWLRDWFRSDPAVHVMLDRRRGERRREQRPVPVERRRGERRRSADFWQDVRFHPVVLVPLSRSAGPARTAAPPERPPESKESDMMDTTMANEARQRVLNWAQEAQHILGRVIPSVFDEHEALRRRVEDAERDCERLRAENGLLRDQLNELRAKHQAVLAGQTEIVQSVGKFMTNMTQILEPMRELAEKMQHLPRGD